MQASKPHEKLPDKPPRVSVPGASHHEPKVAEAALHSSLRTSAAPANLLRAQPAVRRDACLRAVARLPSHQDGRIDNVSSGEP